jgi:hypothetical protein
MSLNTQNPLFDNRQECPAVAQGRAWEALKMVRRVERYLDDPDVPQRESVQKVVNCDSLTRENTELQARIADHSARSTAWPKRSGNGIGDVISNFPNPDFPVQP